MVKLVDTLVKEGDVLLVSYVFRFASLLLFPFRCVFFSGRLRLIVMRIRFRASDFGEVAKTNIVRANRKFAV